MPIDEIAGFLLGHGEPARCPAGPFPAGIGRHLRGGSGGSLRLLQEFFFRLFPRLLHRSGFLLRHHKGPVLVFPIPIGLHEPFGELMGQWQEHLCLLHGFEVFMHRLVPRYSQGMEDIREVAGDQPLPQKHGNPHRGPVVPGKRHSVIGKDEVHDGFSHHPELHEAGVGIRVAILLRQSPKAGQDGEFVL